MTGGWCFIDDCPNRATLVIASHPDDVTLCDEHRHLKGGLEEWEWIVLNEPGGSVVREETPDAG